MKNKKSFLQEHLVVDFEDSIHYMTILEFEDGIPVFSFTVKMPEPWLEFPSNPYLFN